jgi:hypothetical protein
MSDEMTPRTTEIRKRHLKHAVMSLAVVLFGVVINEDAFAATLDLSKFEITFSEEFDGPLSVSPWGPNTRWIAHTRLGGGFWRRPIR